MTAMAGDNFSANNDPEPELRRIVAEPKGVLQRDLKTLVYLGAALLVIVAAIFSGGKPREQRVSHHSLWFRTTLTTTCKI